MTVQHRTDLTQRHIWEALARLSLVLTACISASACAPGNPVTGQNDEDPTINGSQAETAATRALAHETPVLVIAYNDDTVETNPATNAPYVQYSPTGRVVFPGASLLGWSYSTNGGSTWKYGGKVRPPAELGISALWGDPAIVTSKYSPNLVYISALAADSQIVPSAGLSGNMATSGACIARSTNGGIAFSVFQCFSTNRDFYDGASLAAAGGPGDHRIFAAYTDMNLHQIHVWQSDDGLTPFHRITDPFPGMSAIAHPRMAYDDETGALLIAAMAFNPAASDYRIYMNRLVGNQWQTPKLVSQPATSVFSVPVGTASVRTASSFSFDVGTPSRRRPQNSTYLVRLLDVPDGIRLLYTTRDSAMNRSGARRPVISATRRGTSGTQRSERLHWEQGRRPFGRRLTRPRTMAPIA
jgi:hypothetical protein